MENDQYEMLGPNGLVGEQATQFAPEEEEKAKAIALEAATQAAPVPEPPPPPDWTCPNDAKATAQQPQPFVEPPPPPDWTYSKDGKQNKAENKKNVLTKIIDDLATAFDDFERKEMASSTPKSVGKKHKVKVKHKRTKDKDKKASDDMHTALAGTEFCLTNNDDLMTAAALQTDGPPTTPEKRKSPKERAHKSRNIAASVFHTAMKLRKRTTQKLARSVKSSGKSPAMEGSTQIETTQVTPNATKIVYAEKKPNARAIIAEKKSETGLNERKKSPEKVQNKKEERKGKSKDRRKRKSKDRTKKKKPDERRT